MDKKNVVDTMEYYSAIKKKKSYHPISMDGPEDILLIEII
jgi:hypothetical protein